MFPSRTRTVLYHLEWPLGIVPSSVELAIIEAFGNVFHVPRDNPQFNIVGNVVVLVIEGCEDPLFDVSTQTIHIFSHGRKKNVKKGLFSSSSFQNRTAFHFSAANSHENSNSVITSFTSGVECSEGMVW